MRTTARDALAPCFAVRHVQMVGTVTAAALAVRRWRARGRAVKRGRENGDRSEVIARLRMLLEREVASENGQVFEPIRESVGPTVLPMRSK